jgi:hypothetical protein
MAKVYIAEFETMPNVPGGGAQIAPLPPIAEQTVNITTETDSNAFNVNTHFIRVHADAICSIAAGAAPTASTSTLRLAADQTEYFAVQPGHKLSVITNT